MQSMQQKKALLTSPWSQTQWVMPGTRGSYFRSTLTRNRAVTETSDPRIIVIVANGIVGDIVSLVRSILRLSISQLMSSIKSVTDHSASLSPQYRGANNVSALKCGPKSFLCSWLRCSPPLTCPHHDRQVLRARTKSAVKLTLRANDGPTGGW